MVCFGYVIVKTVHEVHNKYDDDDDDDDNSNNVKRHNFIKI